MTRILILALATVLTLGACTHLPDPCPFTVCETWKAGGE